jgi:hypothetical protein
MINAQVLTQDPRKETQKDSKLFTAKLERTSSKALLSKTLILISVFEK